MNTAIETPEGIRFADEASEANYQKAMEGTPGKYGFKPMIVISSPRQGSGKTMLARHILKHRLSVDAAVRQCPETETEWAKMLPSTLDAGYLLLDNVGGLLHSDTLAAFLTAVKWTWRPLGRQEFKVADVNVQVVVTGNGATLSMDLANRALFIELA